MTINRIFISIAMAGFLTACDEIESQVDKQLESIFYKGTQIGVQKCVKRNEGNNSMLSSSTIRDRCIQKHQETIPTDSEGTAGYNREYRGTHYFSGQVKNKGTKYVITSFRVRVTHNDMKKGVSDTKVFTNKWIEPNSSGSFKINSTELSFQPKSNRLILKGKHLHDWSLSNIKGVSIIAD